LWAKQNAVGEGSIKYPKPIESNPYTFSVVRLEDDESALLAVAFLSWRMTWSPTGFGWVIDYAAAKDALKRYGFGVKEYIDTLYTIKEAWIGAELGRKRT